MLTSISPLGERARHNRWAVTAAWYVAGSVVAAMLVGAALGAAGSSLGIPGPARAVVLAVAAAAAALADGLALRSPGPRRQVDEDWLGRYRGWVYGAGFGAQLGAGVTTIITTSTIWLCLAAELLCGSVTGGAVIGVAFGAARAAPLLGSARMRTYGELQRRHAAVAQLAPTARRATTAAAVALAVGFAIIAGVAS